MSSVDGDIMQVAGRLHADADLVFLYREVKRAL